MRWLALILALWAFPLAALEPGEMLDDPVLEERAREISKGLRCPVCQNESIDESHADIARDLRLLVRERLLAGDTDAQVVEYVVERYGQFVMLRPDATGANLVLWLAAPAMLLVGLGIGWATVRRRAGAQPAGADALSEAEKDRLKQLLGD